MWFKDFSLSYSSLQESGLIFPASGFFCDAYGISEDKSDQQLIYLSLQETSSV